MRSNETVSLDHKDVNALLAFFDGLCDSDKLPDQFRGPINEEPEDAFERVAIAVFRLCGDEGAACINEYYELGLDDGAALAAYDRNPPANGIPSREAYVGMLYAILFAQGKAEAARIEEYERELKTGD